MLSSLRFKIRHSALLIVTWSFFVSICSANPTLTGFYPTGAKSGSKSEITVIGSFDVWPVSFWCSNSDVKITPLAKKGVVTIETQKNSPVGPCWIRAYDPKGFSSEKVFFLGNLIELPETEPNDLPGLPQKIKEPTTLSGKLQKPGDVDCYSYSLKKGETLIASVIANQFLQAPMDAVIQVVSPEGFVLAQDHDEKKLDPELIYTAPKTGEYIIRIFAFPSTPDSTIRFAGGDAYNYRLTLTNGPFPIAPWPLATGALDHGTVQLRGWNLSHSKTLHVSPTKNPGESQTLSMPDWGQSVNLLRTREKSISHNESTAKLPLEVPFSISLETNPTQESQKIFIRTKKDKILEIEAKSDSLGWQMSPVVRIRDSNNTLVKTMEPSDLHKDTEGIFSPKQDGIYSMDISDLFGHNSPRHICQFTVRDALPDWDLKTTTESIKLENEKPSELTLNLIGRNNFNNLVEIEAVGLPEGVKMERKQPGKAGDKTITLVFKAKSNFTPGPFQLLTWTGAMPAQKKRVQISRENSTNRPDIWIQMVPTASSKSPG